MQRITDTTAASSLPPPPSLTGTAGYFTGGSPGSVPATIVPDWYLNMLQEELMSLLTAAGITPDTTATNFTQVLQAIQRETWHYATDTGAANAYVATLNPTPASLNALKGTAIRVKIATKNTGASTLNVNGLGATTVVSPDGGALTEGQLSSGGIATLCYDGTNFQLLNPAVVAGGGCLLTLSSAQSIPNNSEVAVTWPTPIYDTDGIATPGGGGFTIPSGVSKVRLTGQLTFANNSTGARKMRVLKNGTIEGTGLFAVRLGTPDSADVSVLNATSSIISVSPGDVLQLMAYQTSGGALNLAPAIDNWFALEIVR